MKRWEDIAKDKLEGYESRLPEGSLAEFRARRAGGGAARPRPRFAAAWALAGAAAVLVAALLLWKPQTPDDGIRIVQQPPVAAPAPQDSSAVAEAPAGQPLVAQAAAPQAPGRPAARPAAPASAPSAAPAEPAPAAPDAPDASVPDLPEQPQAQPEQPQAPEPAEDPEEVEEYFPQELVAEFYRTHTMTPQPAGMKIGTASGIVGGGGLLAALAATPKGPDGREMTPPKDGKFMSDYPVSGHWVESIRSVDDHFPLKAGLSLRIPVADRLSVTTGLEYTLYTSVIEFARSGEKRQYAHYLGVPVRLDFSLASSRRLDLYLGAGFAVDYCLGATLDGEPLRKDGFSFSLVAASGIQFNLTPRLGLYLEPELSWTAPAPARNLITYRTGHPLTFSLATGLRITLGNQK